MTDSNGLAYMRARYYSPEIRRFVNRDVLIGSIDDSQSLNRFAYVNGEPISSVDPFGLSPLGVDWGQAGRDISTGFQKTCEANSPGNWQRELESAWNTNKRDLQNGLDVAGTAPLTGSVFDVANCLIYLSNGNRSEAKKYLFYAAPVVGDGAQGFKAAKRIKAVEKSNKVVRPSYRANPAHNTKGARYNPKKTPEPSDAAKVYEKSITVDGGKTYYGIGKNGKVYRYFNDNAGGVHFSGTPAKNDIPNSVRRQLGIKQKGK